MYGVKQVDCSGPCCETEDGKNVWLLSHCVDFNVDAIDLFHYIKFRYAKCVSMKTQKLTRCNFLVSCSKSGELDKYDQ